MIGKSTVLIDGEELTRLMFEYDLRVTPVEHYVLKKKSITITLKSPDFNEQL
jgi:restriction endonuclease Mrr